MSLLPRGLTATFLSHSTNPYVNLSLETYLFSTLPQTHVLLFYRNNPSVVIGRNQNPFSQVNLSRVDFLRRYSGGGTVYHDLGNVNFSIRMPRHEFNRQTYANMIVRAVERKDVNGCKVTERGDIVMFKGEEGYKVSGSAYKVSKDIAYHHGTMLLGSEMGELRRALSVDGRVMIRDKGVDSVRANHVSNVPFPGEDNNVKFNEFVDLVREEFAEMHGKNPLVELAQNNVIEIPEVKKGIEKLTSWEWKFGQTPEFTERLTLDDKGSTITCTVKHGLITSLDIAAKTNQIEKSIPALQNQLVNQRYSEFFLVKPTDPPSPIHDILNVA